MTTAYTESNRADQMRVPHHPAHVEMPAPPPLWRRVFRRIILFFTR